MNKTKIKLLPLVVALMSPIGIASCGSSTPDQREEKPPILQSEQQAVHHQEVTLNLSGGSVVAIPNIIGVQSGDIVEFESRDGEPDIAFDPPSAIRLDQKTEHSERITVLQAPFEFYCGLIVRGEYYGWKDGGIGLPDPPTVTAIDPSILAQGSSDTVITATGADFANSSIGQVNGNNRYTQYVSNTSVRITVTAADLAQPGQLQIAVKNVTASNSVVLTVQ